MFDQLDLPASILLILISLIGFICTYLIYGIIPATFLIKKIKTQLVRRDIILVCLLGMLNIFVVNYLFSLLQIPNILIYLLGLTIIIFTRKNKPLRSYLRNMGRIKKRESIVFILILMFALTWTLPSILNGLPTNDGSVLFSPSLGGERLLFTAYGQSALKGIPPAHPYWANYDLSYHYFGMIIQSFFVLFGLNAMVVNFMILPTVIALLCGVSLWQLGRRYTSFWFALAAPIVFFLWDNLSWMLPASLHYPDRQEQWWLTPFQAQHHAYLNGQSYQFAALFIILTVFLLQAIFSTTNRKRRVLPITLLAITVSSLLLIKVQVFMVVVISLIIWQICLLLRRDNRSNKNDLLKMLLVFWSIFIILTTFFVYTNESFLLVKNSDNLSWRPFDEIHTSFYALNRQDEYLGIGIGYLTDYLAYPQLKYYKPLLAVSISAVIFTFGASLIGLLAIFRRKLRQDPIILFGLIVSLVSIFCMYALYIGDGNQWQFSYVAYPFLSLLVATTLYQLSRSLRLSVFIMLTIISIPTMWGQLTMYMDGYVKVPQSDIKLMISLSDEVDKNSNCLLALPKEDTAETGEKMHIINQIREVIFPVYANCNLIASYGPRTVVNIRPDQRDQILNREHQQFLNVDSKEGFKSLVSNYKPNYVFVAKNNLYSISGSDLAELGYVQLLETKDSGTVLTRQR